MPSPELLSEARRLMTICNACRYCEGFCAVFPAMEMRRTFASQDLIYLANLCHNCRGCYYACQYAPPHEFGVNVPRTFSALRLESYRDFAWPAGLAGLFRRNGLALSLITLTGVLLVGLLVLVWQDPSVVFSPHTGPGAFYEVIPYRLMVAPALVLSGCILLAFCVGLGRFWRAIGGGRADLPALARGGRDALRLTYLGGGGHGCTYPDAAFSQRRKWLHHLTFYGFLLDLAATSLAAAYHHLLHWPAPYPYLSLPVVLGTLGGLGLLVGPAGLLWLKWRSDPRPAAESVSGMDVSFLVLLFLTSLSGLALLALRETAAMGSLLAVHLGIVAGLFLTFPYGKFVHALYRYAALVRYAQEQAGTPAD